MNRLIFEIFSFKSSSFCYVVHLIETQKRSWASQHLRQRNTGEQIEQT